MNDKKSIEREQMKKLGDALEDNQKELLQRKLENEVGKFELPDSGARTHFDTGAVRDMQQDKGRYDLLPPKPLKRLAVHYERGARKYNARNWEKGIPMSACFSSTVRHLFQWLDGDESEDHLAAAVWNLFAIMHFEEEMPEMNDIWKENS